MTDEDLTHLNQVAIMRGLAQLLQLYMPSNKGTTDVLSANLRNRASETERYVADRAARCH